MKLFNVCANKLSLSHALTCGVKLLEYRHAQV